MTSHEPVWERIDFDSKGLRGRKAKILVDDPMSDMGDPADLPPNTSEVIIVDDTPSVFLDLEVHPVGHPEMTTLIKHIYLAVEVRDGSARPEYTVPAGGWPVPWDDLPPLPPREIQLPPVRESVAQHSEDSQ